jgi:hypothetical protein
MPVEQGPFEYIVNVQWEGGLAVEFGNQAEDAPVETPTIIQTKHELSQFAIAKFG